MDNDDDGDGYITAEEGANPDGTGRDTDGNGIQDYLDANDKIFEETKDISFNDYLNLIGTSAMSFPTTWAMSWLWSMTRRFR